MVPKKSNEGCVLKMKLIRRKLSSSFFNTFLGVSFWETFLVRLRKEQIYAFRKLTVSPLQGASGRSFSDSGGI